MESEFSNISDSTQDMAQRPFVLSDTEHFKEHGNGLESDNANVGTMDNMRNQKEQEPEALKSDDVAATVGK